MLPHNLYLERMIIFKDAGLLFSFIASKKEQKQIGFVPTMGALHFGHLSLIRSCKAHNDYAVCSIFVNPTQFNNPEDLKHYPVTIEKDIEMLIEAGCDILFLPSADQVYPADYQKKTYDLGNLETILEGKYRPGHFQGVCQVVDRLLEIVQPHRIYFGQKDYQQCMVIRKLLRLLHKEDECELIIEPTIREKSGLAMSSRNLRLSQEDREGSVSIFKVLEYMKDNLDKEPVEDLKNKAQELLEKKGFVVDYAAIADANTLEPSTDKSAKLVGLVAATINNVRLIDNMVLN